MLTDRAVAASVRARYSRMAEAASVETTSPGLDVEAAYAEVTTTAMFEGIADAAEALSTVGAAAGPYGSAATVDRGRAGHAVVSDLKLEVADLIAEAVHENQVFNAVL